MSHTGKPLQSITPLEAGEKQLANAAMLDKRIKIINTDLICAEKEQNCPKQKSSATGNRRIIYRNENQKNADGAPDITKHSQDRWQKEPGCAKGKSLDAS